MTSNDAIDALDSAPQARNIHQAGTGLTGCPNRLNRERFCFQLLEGEVIVRVLRFSSSSGACPAVLLGWLALLGPSPSTCALLVPPLHSASARRKRTHLLMVLSSVRPASSKGCGSDCGRLLSCHCDAGTFKMWNSIVMPSCDQRLKCVQCCIKKSPDRA